MTQSLTESENHFRVMNDLARDAMVLMDADGLIAYWNRAAEQMFGYSAAEAIGQNLHQLLAPARYHADYQRGLADFLTRGQGPAVDRLRELWALRRDGGEFPIELAVSAIRQGDRWQAVGIMRDISQRKAAESQLHLQTTALESAANAIVLTDLAGVIQWINPAFVALTGYSAAEVVGQNPRILKSGRQDDSFYQRMWRTILAGEMWHGEMINRHKDGSFYTEEMTVAPVKDDHGCVTNFIAIKQDISERIRMQEERDSNARSLHAALLGTIEAVSLTIEKRDPYTAGHQRRVARLAQSIARRLGWDQARLDGIYMGGLIHDVGKIYVPSEILNRPGRLSAVEFELIKSHADVGYDIVKGVHFNSPIAEMIHQHHERLDGSGYPNKLAGAAILPEARVLAVADVVEAMSSHRPYRVGLGVDAALEEISRGKGALYDPEAVEVCIDLFRQHGFRLENGV